MAEHGSYDEGELEALESAAFKRPDKFIEISDFDSIDVGNLSGKSVVLGCPCNALAEHEDFLLAHRWQILRYFQLLAEQAAKRAADAAKIAADLADALATAKEAP
jgi:hypothetical protein